MHSNTFQNIFIFTCYSFVLGIATGDSSGGEVVKRMGRTIKCFYVFICISMYCNVFKNCHVFIRLPITNGLGYFWRSVSFQLLLVMIGRASTES